MNNFDTIISACLVGIPCRYNKKAKNNKKAIECFLKGKALLVCPEIFSGQKTPRKACEIIGGDGFDVLNGKAKVIDKNGKDYTDQFIKGSEIVLKEIVKKNNIKKAILKSGSPSCGVKNIFNGKFNGKKIKGCGVLVALLKKNRLKNIEEE